MKKVIVLGCGMVGATIARDLAADPDLDVTVADRSEENLGSCAGVGRLKTVPADLGATDRLAALVRGSDVVVGALPSALGLSALRTVIECGRPYCDISFVPEDALELDALAREKGVTAVVDCGVAPGLANLFVGRAHAELDETERVAIYVGGLPVRRTWPFQYQAPFAPGDVIEEYTRPARMKEGGRLVTKPALSEPELVEFDRVGTLEAFNTDGLRSLLRTIDAPDMKEKTLRYPGHAELMRAFRETGLFDKTPIEAGGVRVRPLDVTERLLRAAWRRAPGEPEFTVLRVVVEGRKAGRRLRHVFELYDEYDPAADESSMARTTGFPAAITARLLAAGCIREAGVFAPEQLGRNAGVFDAVLSGLAARDVTVQRRCERMA